MQKGKYKHLTNTEREEISRCLANKQPFAKIARQLGRATSTISREVYRNSGQTGYRAFGARKRAQTAASSRRAGKSKIAKNKRLRDYIHMSWIQGLFQNQVCCLLRFEPTDEQCHRRLAAERIQNYWKDIEVIHL